MINKYVIYEQYEYWGNNGKTFTEWFVAPMTSIHNTEKGAKEELKIVTENSKAVDKATKLKHCFEIRYIDVETLPKPPIKFHKKGRPSKAEIDRKTDEYNNYWKNQTFID